MTGLSIGCVCRYVVAPFHCSLTNSYAQYFITKVLNGLDGSWRLWSAHIPLKTCGTSLVTFACHGLVFLFFFFSLTEHDYISHTPAAWSSQALGRTDRMFNCAAVLSLHDYVQDPLHGTQPLRTRRCSNEFSLPSKSCRQWFRQEPSW